MESWLNFCRLHGSIADAEAAQRQSGEVFRDVPGVSIPVVAVLMSAPYAALRRRVEEMRQLMAFECAQGLERKKATQAAQEAHLLTTWDRDGQRFWGTATQARGES